MYVVQRQNGPLSDLNKTIFLEIAVAHKNSRLNILNTSPSGWNPQSSNFVIYSDPMVISLSPLTQDFDEWLLNLKNLINFLLYLHN